MAKLYICEYTGLGISDDRLGGNQQVGMEAGFDQTPVVIGAGSLPSNAFAATTRLVRIHTDVICSIAFGANPTATTNTKRLEAGQTEYFGVPPGQSFRVAVIANT